MSYTDSYYTASVDVPEPAPQLEDDTKCDVCVIGGGLSGISAALHLAERGYRTVLLEDQRIGWAASGRSGGQVIFGYACSMDTLEDLLGPEDARRMWDMSIEAIKLLRERVERHRIDCDLVWGMMHAALKPRHNRELAEWQSKLETHYGYDSLQLIEGAELQSLIATDRYIAGLLDTASGHVHPLKYTLGLARAARQAGVVVYENSRAIALDRGRTVRVRTRNGVVECDYLVICGNAGLDSLVPELRRKIMPVGSYIVATEPLGEKRARQIVFNNMAVADMNFVLDYFRLSADHRLLFGGRVSYSTIQPTNIAESIRRRMRRVFPQLSDVSIDYAWGGLVDITMNRAPHFGRLADNVFFAQGFSGHGMALTGMAGKVIAKAVAGSAERLDVFARIPHRNFPGGPWFRTPTLVLAMLWYRLRDLLP